VRKIFGVISVFALVSTAHAQPARFGTETIVNTYYTGAQLRPAVTETTGGDYVVVWEDGGADGDSGGVFGRRFDRTGTPVGDDFFVNTYVALRQGSPRVAASADGGFVVVWEGDIQDGHGYGVFGQRFDSTGVFSGTEFPVNTFTTGHQRNPDVIAAADGRFTVVWASDQQDGSDYGLVGRLFDSGGLPASDEFFVNSYTSQTQNFPRAAADGDGNFVVVWASYDGRDGDGYGVFGQRFDSVGTLVGTEFGVNTFTTGAQQFPALSLTDEGFVIVWESFGVDGSNEGVSGRRYDGAGAPVDSEFVVNTYAYDSQRHPDVARDSDGGFVVAWDSIGLDGDGNAVIAQRFDSTGAVGGLEIQVNTYATGDQQSAAVAGTSDGRFIIAWQSEGADDSSEGIASQRFLVQTPECGRASQQPLQVVGELPGEPSMAVTATDALVVLAASVGAGECLLCVCDVNNTLTVTATDALIVLNVAVGVSQSMVCPAVCI